MTKKDLEKDKTKLEGLIAKGLEEKQQLEVQLLRWDGALGYINDNLKEDKC